MVDTYFDMAFPFLNCALARVEKAGSHLVVADHADANQGTPIAEKTDAGNVSYGICHVIDASRSPSPEPKRPTSTRHVKTIKELFQGHCGARLDKFMEAIYLNPQGKVELKFWQERLVNSFLQQHPELGLDSQGIMELIRDGSEMIYRCPVEDCWGDVACLDRRTDEWGCGECGTGWHPKSALMDAIEEAELRGDAVEDD